MAETNTLDGKAYALKVREDVRQKVAGFVDKGQRAPGLATVLVGEDAASQVYVRNKHRAAEKAGIVNFHHQLPADISQNALLETVENLNKNDNVDGILVQLPLPPHLDADEVIEAIAPSKDVDGFHPQSTSALYQGKPTFVPCTPKGCMVLLESLGEDLTGKKCGGCRQKPHRRQTDGTSSFGCQLYGHHLPFTNQRPCGAYPQSRYRHRGSGSTVYAHR